MVISRAENEMSTVPTRRQFYNPSSKRAQIGGSGKHWEGEWGGTIFFYFKCKCLETTDAQRDLYGIFWIYSLRL